MPPIRSAAWWRLSLRLEAALSRACRKDVFAWSTTWSFTSRICVRAPLLLVTVSSSAPGLPPGDALESWGIVIVSLLCAEGLHAPRSCVAIQTGRRMRLQRRACGAPCHRDRAGGRTGARGAREVYAGGRESLAS